jgi:hypothetical protein
VAPQDAVVAALSILVVVFGLVFPQLGGQQHHELAILQLDNHVQQQNLRKTLFF